MQLCCGLKNNTNSYRYYLRKAAKAFAILMCLLFLTISFAQALHHHHTHSSKTGVKHSLSIPEKCIVCDYIIHNQTKICNESHDFEFLVPVKQLTRIYPGFAYRIFQIDVHIYTNKGPPLV